MPWDHGKHHVGLETVRHTINQIEMTVRLEYRQELSGGPISDRALRGMRVRTQELLAEKRVNVEDWRQLNWWRDHEDRTVAIMYA
jgi:hypothetical protein